MNIRITHVLEICVWKCVWVPDVQRDGRWRTWRLRQRRNYKYG